MLESLLFILARNYVKRKEVKLKVLVSAGRAKKSAILNSVYYPLRHLHSSFRVQGIRMPNMKVDSNKLWCIHMLRIQTFKKEDLLIRLKEPILREHQ